jgi:NAD(P)-dependent dehydrogenase (short-subunit alcohol dehydrogenase family)
MKIVIVGATGTIGKHVVSALEEQLKGSQQTGGHQIVKVGSKSGDVRVDIGDPQSIKSMYEKIGAFDALVCAAGEGHFGPLAKMTDADFRVSVNSKLMGQVNLVLIGQHYINPKGSFTLISGSLADDPVPYGASVSSINAAIDGFVRGAAIELENGVRINSVAPGVVEDSPGYFPFFPGDIPVSMHKAARAYVKSVFGAATGKTYRVVE